MDLNMPAINDLITDLLDPDFEIKFNPAYTCILDENDVICGDASLFLAIRHAPIQNNSDIFAWYETVVTPEDEAYTASDVVFSMYTGIPLETARELLYPRVPVEFIGTSPRVDAYGHLDFDFTAKEFVKVLRGYLKTNVVDWTVVLR